MQQQKSKKTLVAIFAHPDDEAFGPSGTLAKYSETHDVHILCATKGELGGKSTEIAHVRENELKKSAKILGVKKVIFLGFTDGSLCNCIYHDLANEISKHLKKLKPDIILTYEMRGVSGHIDHITVSLATTYVATKLKFIKKIMYYCILDRERDAIKDYFIYFPEGFKKSQVDIAINVEKYWDKKIAAIKIHKSQKKDGKAMLNILDKIPKEELFFISKQSY